MGRAIAGVVRMYSDDGEDILMTLGYLDGQSIAFDRSDRANRDDLRYARGGGARDHGLDVVAKLCIREMAMGVDDHRA
jgi:hypothetical protein